MSYRIRYVPPADPILGSGTLKIETLDESGAITNQLEVLAADVADDLQRAAVEIFAFNVAEQQRKAVYLARWPLSAGEHNRAKIEIELQEDFADWCFRDRRGRDRYEGLGDKAIRDWQMQR